MTELLLTSALPTGSSPSSVYSAFHRGDVVRLAPGAFLASDAWARLSPEQRYRRVAGAMGQGRILTGRSVMALEGFPLWPAPQEVDVAHRSDSHRGLGARLPQGQRVRVHQWDGPLETRKGCECVPLDSALLVALTRLPFESGVILADAYLRQAALQQSAPHSGWVSPEAAEVRRGQLLEALAASRLRIGRGRAREALLFADALSESVGESRSRVLFHESGLPAPVLQKSIQLETGELLRGDFYWPEAHVIGEFDGKVKYGKLLRPGETPQEAALRERKREKILQSMGFGIVRWDWGDLSHPQRILGWLRQAGVR